MPRFARRQKVLLFTCVLLAATGLTGAALKGPATSRLRAMSVLVKFSDPKAQGLVASFAQHPVKEEAGTAQTPQGTLKFRVYLPQDVDHPGGVVLVHGIHQLGIEDPRLVSLARAMAGSGVAIMTPQIQDLTEYRVTPESIDVIGSSAAVFSVKLGEPSVGLIGMSFAGGLSLLAANKPEYSNHIGFVLAVGAHDDMSRVARFFVENSIEAPDGVTTAFQAHEYGVLVFAYTHLEAFFSAEDIPDARDAVRQILWEKPDPNPAADKLSPAGREKLDQLLHHREALHQVLLDSIKTHSAEMDAVSPHGKLGKLTVPVYLLHGTGDTLIPSSETLWLSRDVPAQDLRAVLVSPALIHVDMGKKVPRGQQWELVSFMAGILNAADELSAAK